jgi:hypothetical protein
MSSSGDETDKEATKDEGPSRFDTVEREIELVSVKVPCSLLNVP